VVVVVVIIGRYVADDTSHVANQSIMISGSEDGLVGVWDVRGDIGRPTKLMAGWQGGSSKEGAS